MKGNKLVLYSLEISKLKIKVYDASGRCMSKFNKNPSTNKMILDFRKTSQKVYFIQFYSDHKEIQREKILVIK